MALNYSGATAGSTLANPPVLLFSAIGGHAQFVSSGSTAAVSNLPVGASGAKLWFYASTNLFTDMIALNSIGDGVALGMSIGDVLIGVYTTAASTAPVVYMAPLVTSAGATGFSISSNAISSTAV